MSSIRRGDEGDAVTRVQQVLRGWEVPVEDPPGRFGLWTEAALFVLQREEGLVVDGVVGPQTAARLEAPARPACFSQPPVSAMTLIAGVPYLSQRDNAHAPGTSCNVTSLAMAMLYHGAERRRPQEQLEDELYELLRSPQGIAYYRTHSPQLFAQGTPANEVYDNLVWAARQYGLAASFEESRGLVDIRREIAGSRPVLLSGKFTAAGHIVLLIGLTAGGDLICHDPWGDWTRGYGKTPGEARIYERDRALAALKPVGAQAKWGLFIGR